MSKEKIVALRRKRRTFRVRNNFTSRGKKLRISVFRSLRHISAQIIDDVKHRTLLSYSSLSIADKIGDKCAVAKIVGQELGKKALEKSLNNVFFDRGSYRYHGRVKAFVEGLRESGLTL